VSVDRPDDTDVPSGETLDGSTGRSNGNGESHAGDGAVRAETRSRGEYYDDMRAAAAGQARAEPRQTSAPERDANGKPWNETAGWSRRVWAEYQDKWPPGERASVDGSDVPPGSWRGGGGRSLDSAANGRAEQWCDRNEQCERDKTTPKMRAIEDEDPDRYLTGLEYRLKGRDRIKEKVAESMKEEGTTVDEALSLVKDAIRYTFIYEDDCYTDGVKADLARMENNGFEQVERRNSWEGDYYKGINSRWHEPATGRLFEVQFHTRISFEAKQLTHGAYERLRSGQTSELEQLTLEAFQGRVFGAVPIPPGAADIPEYPGRD
jgi:hypothetical protein